MNIKIQNDKNETKNICVVDETVLNSALILNIDLGLNDTFETVLDAVKFAVETVDNNKYITKQQKTVNDSLKRNTLIVSEYEAIKSTVFKNVGKVSFNELNDLIDEELMLLQLKGNTKKCYNSFDFWATHKDQRLKKYIENYKRLNKYLELAKRLE